MLRIYGFLMVTKFANKKSHHKIQFEVFPLLCIFITIVIILFICASVASILIGGIGNLSDIIFSDEVRFSFRMSIITSTVSSFIVMLISLPASYALTKTNMPLKKLSGVIVELTLSLPFLLLGLCLLMVFSSPFGHYLKDLGFKVIFTPNGIIMAHVFVNLPYAIRLIKTAFESVDKKTQMVAHSLGASSFQFFYSVLIPMCRASIINVFLLVWTRAIGEFGATLMLVGVTRFKTETLPGSIYLSISTGNNETAMATAIIMLALSCSTLLLADWITKKEGSK